MRAVEIRSYEILPGNRDAFHRLFYEEAVPMLRRWGVDVVSYGASPHDESSYYLIRAYASLEERQAHQDAFYGSEEWRNGPREPILSLIAHYTSFVMLMTDDAVEVLRSASVGDHSAVLPPVVEFHSMPISST